MDADEGCFSEEQQEKWRRGLTVGRPLLRRWRRLMRVLPSDPRCKMCYNPFGGVGGRALRLIGYAPSRKNPRFCNT